MATFTFNPSPGVTVDGIVARDNVNETWATIQGSAGNLADDTSVSTTGVQVTCSTTNNQFKSIVQSIYLFDTSALTSGATITSAVLSLVCPTGSRVETLGSQSLVVVGSTPASNTALATSDYHTNVGTTAFSATYTISGLTVDSSTYNDFTLTSFVPISLTGITKLAIRMESDRSNTAPTWGSGARSCVDFFFSDNASLMPKLTVTTGSSTNASILLSLL